MAALVAIYLRPETAARLQRLSVLAGSVDDALSRLVDHWERGAETPATTSQRPKPEGTSWRSSSGDTLPVGTQLEGTYRGKSYFAKVEKTGIRFGKETYTSPSAAAMAVKHACGVAGRAAYTDGRAFWKLRDPSSGSLVSISALHGAANIDSEKLLAELESWGSKSVA